MPGMQGKAATKPVGRAGLQSRNNPATDRPQPPRGGQQPLPGWAWRPPACPSSTGPGQGNRHTPQGSEPSSSTIPSPEAP